MGWVLSTQLICPQECLSPGAPTECLCVEVIAFVMHTPLGLQVYQKKKYMFFCVFLLFLFQNHLLCIIIVDCTLYAI